MDSLSTQVYGDLWTSIAHPLSSQNGFIVYSGVFRFVDIVDKHCAHVVQSKMGR